MQVFNRSTVRAYADTHPRAKSGLEAWYTVASNAVWSKSHDVKASDPTVSLIGDRLVFNIHDNAYRLVARVDWQRGWLFIRFIGTHQEYDRITVSEI